MNRRNRRLTGALAAALALAAAGSAQAATSVGVSGATLKVSAQPGRTNGIVVTQPAGRLLVHEGADFVAAGAGCWLIDPQTASCPIAGIASIAIEAGDGNDVVTNWATLASRIAGGTGNDQLRGGSGPDLLIGGFGDDVLSSADGIFGNDRLDGESGLDNCTADPGDMRLNC